MDNLITYRIDSVRKQAPLKLLIQICVGGRGWYQEWGKPARELHPGDVVNIPAGVKHWHGAASDSWFSHLAIEVEGENTSNEWLEPVDDDQYKAL